jgi:hypothetical protein
MYEIVGQRTPFPGSHQKEFYQYHNGYWNVFGLLLCDAMTSKDKSWAERLLLPLPA